MLNLTVYQLGFLFVLQTIKLYKTDRDLRYKMPTLTLVAYKHNNNKCWQLIFTII